MPIDTHLKSDLEEADRLYGGDNIYKMLGPTLLSWTNTDSSRMYMYTSHLKQVLVLNNPDVPRLQTKFENTFGKRNKAYKQLEGTWTVVAKIPKFIGYENSDYNVYTLVLYNKATDTYDMIEKPIAENLTEKFGYLYNTEVMDSLPVGTKITNPILYKSKSYDKNMNYCFGKNARVAYSISTDTLEDAIPIRKGWADGVKSTEVDFVDVSLNNNDILLNLCGTDDEYKAFPNIGEKVSHSRLCATRRVNKNHILYDFQTSNMRETYDTDTEYFVSKDSVVYDIEVFYNGEEEFPDNLFHRQLKYYYEQNCRYADEMLAWTNKIKESGSNYTKNVNAFRDRYLHYNDKEYAWKGKDRAFGHIIVRFKVHAEVGLDLGSKMSG